MSQVEVANLDIEARDLMVRFELLLNGRSQPVAVAVEQAFEDAASKDDWLRLSARSAMPLLLTGWRAGLHSGPDVYREYSERRELVSRKEE